MAGLPPDQGDFENLSPLHLSSIYFLHEDFSTLVVGYSELSGGLKPVPTSGGCIYVKKKKDELNSEAGDKKGKRMFLEEEKGGHRPA